MKTEEMRAALAAFEEHFPPLGGGIREMVIAAKREAEERMREQAWSHAYKGMENGPELNSQAIYEAICVLPSEYGETP